MWQRDQARLALLELLERGRLRRRQAQTEAFATLAELPWTCASGRRDEIAVAPGRAADLAALIDRVWPEWREVRAGLQAAGLPPTPDGYASYRDRQRAADLPRLPARLNRRTAAALTAAHSKSTLTLARQVALGTVQLLHDGLLRLRPPPGLIAHTPAGTLDLSGVAAILGEVGIAERAFRDGLCFQGAIRAVLLVENLAAWRDMPHPPGWLLAHVPGWDTTDTDYLFRALPQVPFVHFGDLDPAGVRILRHLRRKAPDLLWFTPDFWFDDAGALPVKTGRWPRNLDLSFAPTPIQALAARGQWLEQERIVLDPRLPAALEALLR